MRLDYSPGVPNDEPTSLRSAVRSAARVLAAAGVDGPDAVVLAAHVLGVEPGNVRVAMAMDADLAAVDRERFALLVERRVAREPLQHLTGEAHFRHLTLEVGPGVFVPRPETEVLVDAVLELLRATPVDAGVVDACTGSGAIAIAIATERPGTRVMAIEQSADAHAFAARNVARLAPSVDLVLGDATAAPVGLDGRVDVLVSNPPYVPDDAVPRDPEVRLHDPALALYGGADGLDIVRALADRGRSLVVPGGWIALEHGELQGEAVRSVLAEHDWLEPRTRQDLTGRDRVTIARR